MARKKEIAVMHWRDRWEYEAGREAQSLKRLSERELLELNMPVQILEVKQWQTSCQN